MGRNEELGSLLAGTIVPIAYIAWSAWLIALGVGFILYGQHSFRSRRVLSSAHGQLRYDSGQLEMLTFEYDPDGAVEINVNADGVQALLHILSRLQPGDHEHLSTESWGGYPLTEEFPNRDLVPVHQVTIQFVEAGKTVASGDTPARSLTQARPILTS